jgi:hypothetical protein
LLGMVRAPSCHSAWDSEELVVLRPNQVTWLVLRRFVSHAALWMPANALAWEFGMAVIFASIDPAISGGFGLLSDVILGLTLACAGAVVGAIHGLALVWLLRSSE